MAGLYTRAKENLKALIARMLFRSYSYFIPSSEAGQVQAQPINYLNAADEGYKKAIWAYRCVNEIANRVSSVPFSVYRKKNDELVPVTGAHPLKSILERANNAGPQNQGQSWTSFLRCQSILLNISGNCYYDVSERVGKAPANLYLLRPDRMKIVPRKTRKGTDAKGYVDRYEYYVDSSPDKIQPEDIRHHKKFDPSNDWYGLSPLQVAAYSIDTETQASNWNYSMFKNQARPSGVLYTDSAIGDEQFKNLAKEVQENWQGASNAGRPVILEGGLKWAQTALSQKDADYVQLKKLTREEICGIYGVPPIIVGILDRATYSNYKEADPIFWGQTIIPELEDFTDFFNSNIAVMFDDDVVIGYDLGDIKALKDSEERVSKIAQDNFKSGIITQNEARTIQGYDELPKGNFFLLPAGVMPYYENETVGALQEEPAPARGLYIEMERRAVILDPTKEQVAAFLKISAQRQEKFAKRMAKAVQPILSAYYQDAYKRLMSASGEPSAAAISKAHEKESKKALQEFYEDFYTEGLVYFMNLTKKDLKGSMRGIIIPGLERRDQVTDSLTEDVRAWLEEVTGERVVDVLDTTKLQIKRIIENGLREGKTSKQIADEMLDLDEISSYMRAARISVTETHSIAVAGNFYAMVDADLGEELEKIWHTNIDGRQRDPHEPMNEQHRKMSEPFKSGTGKKLMFPGDSSLGAGADDIVHCRCAVLYDTTKIGGFYGG